MKNKPTVPPRDLSIPVLKPNASHDQPLTSSNTNSFAIEEPGKDAKDDLESDECRTDQVNYYCEEYANSFQMKSSTLERLFSVEPDHVIATLDTT